MKKPTAKRPKPTTRRKPKPTTRRTPAPRRLKKPAYPPKPNGPREITGHQVNELNRKIQILVRDDPGPGGANRDYLVKIDGLRGVIETPLLFQQGNPADGVNGTSNEALLAIVQDRLEGFLAGPFAEDPMNHAALMGVRQALHALQSRTADRVARGVEGTPAK